MSNNNPHGHISQPAQNPSWNPLQIPSYIPRQPQLAHMSNERPMVRSPLAWHAPAPPPESIYNFMSANHKNLDHQMNPLLPPYVRGPSPFDSMDLSVQSSRSTTSPLHKSGGQNSAQPHDYGHKQQQQQHPHQQQQPQNAQQQQQSQLHGSNNYPIHLSTSSPSTITHSHVVTHSHQQQQAQHRQQQSQHPHPNSNPHNMQQTGAAGGIGVPSNAKYLSSNGNDCDMLPPPLSAIGAGSTGGSGGSNSSGGSVPADQSGRYMRENEVHMNENYAKMSNMNRNFDNELQAKSLQKPVELVSKDCNYTLLSNKISHQHQVSPKKHSPIRNYHSHGQQQQQPQYNTSPHTMTHNGPHTPPTPQSPVSQQQSSSSTPPSAANAIHQLNESRIIQDSSIMDYNQLHMQHNNNYGPHSHPHHQQQSQQSSPEHNQDQQQQQSHHMHFGAQMHPQPSYQHQVPAPTTLQQMAQHQSHPPTSPHLTNLDSFSSHTSGKPKELELGKSVITDLSTSMPPAAHKRTQPTNCFPTRTESPGNATSNEDSVDSNSNSSRTRRKRKPNKIGRTSPNESEAENPVSMHAMGLEPSLEGSLANAKTQDIEKTIKQSPEQHRSNRKPDIQSPSSQERRCDGSAVSLLPELKTSLTAPNEGNADVNQNAAKIGSTTHKSQSENEVETIDKIAEMIAKSGSNEIHNSSNSNCSSRSGVGSIGSPKTKKQRQALKLRNSEQNSNSNCSTNSYSESMPGAANDNAVLAEELRKEEASPVNEDAAARPVKNENNASSANISRPLSPQSNSRSCSSSSSSSSSCSNSSHSSSGSKENKHKNDLESSSKTAAVEEHQLALEKQHTLKTNVSGDAETVSTKNEVLKTEDELDTKNILDNCMDTKKEPMKSPPKSCFEEVENKLEEMFAGIEDEPPVAVEEENTLPPAPVHDSEVSKELSLALELATPAIVNSSNVRLHATAEGQTESPSQHPTPSTKPDKPPPTKAAKKSTLPSPVKTNVSTPTPTMPTRVVPPRRRMSVLMDPASLRIALDAENCMDMSQQLQTSCPAAIPIDEKPSTSAAAAAAMAAASKPPNLSQETPTEAKSSPKKKGGKANARKGSTKSKGGAGSKAGKGKAAASKKTQQPQKQKKKHHDSDDFDAPMKESNGNHAVESKYKSPYILVKHDGSISVINAPTAEDVSEKQTKVKKTHHGYAHDRKNLRGMHSSTLSNKYDADTADKTWICVFCKRGPHRMGLGDLFGPYLVSTECEEYKTAVRAPGAVDLDAVFVNKRRRVDMVQCHPRNLPVVPAAGAHSALTTNRGGGSNKKKKKSIDEPPPQPDAPETPADSAHELGNLVGMCKVSETTFEVWLHEDCAVWAPDVFLVGARVMGLNAAVWNSTRYNCVLCSMSGAMICCLQRGCSEAAHVPCARQAQWSLNESNFKIYCQKHASSSGNPSANSASLLLLNRLTTSGFVARQS